MAEKKAKAVSSTGEGKKSFEQNLTELENIVADLERGDLPLEVSIEKYQNGIERLRECNQILKDAQKKVEILTQDAKGALVSKPFPTQQAAGDESNDRLF